MDRELEKFRCFASSCWFEKHWSSAIDLTKENNVGLYRLGLDSIYIWVGDRPGDPFGVEDLPSIKIGYRLSAKPKSEKGCPSRPRFFGCSSVQLYLILFGSRGLLCSILTDWRQFLGNGNALR